LQDGTGESADGWGGGDGGICGDVEEGRLKGNEGGSQVEAGWCLPAYMLGLMAMELARASAGCFVGDLVGTMLWGWSNYLRDFFLVTVGSLVVAKALFIVAAIPDGRAGR
jgi:hypothetical protein